MRRSLPFCKSSLVVLGILLVGKAHGQPAGVQLTAPDAQPVDIFGASVAVQGNLAVVGAGGIACTNDPGCGAAYVYRFNGSTWEFEQKLLSPEPLSYSGYGVALDGDVILLNSWFADCPAGADCGAAYVFRFNGSSWDQEQKLTASDAAANDLFGNHFSVEGDVIVVGSVLDDCPNGLPDCGSAYVFRYNGASWIQEQKLTSSDAAAGDNFGTAVALQGDTILVGADFDNRPGAADCGSVYVFHYNGAAWVEQQRFNASDLGTGDRFGWFVSLDGDTVLIGAPGDDIDRVNDGSAYVFRNIAGTWVQEAKLTASDTCPRDDGGGHFGFSVSVSGDTAVVGAADELYGGTTRGAAYLYRRSGTTWVQERELTPADAVVNDDVGFYVSIDGDWAIVGGWLDDSPLFDAGSAWMYRLHDCNDNGISDEIDISNCGGDPACGDCNGNTIPDGCEFVEGCAVDCNANAIPDSCDLTDCLGDPACGDCNANNIPDACDLASASSQDVDPANGVPDECDPPPPPTVGNDLCVGGSNAGGPCGGHADCPGGFCNLKNRFISFAAGGGTFGVQVTLVNLDPNSVANPLDYNGQSRWVGPASLNVNDGLNGMFNAAPLQCAFSSQNWSGVGTLHLYGSAVVPASQYQIRTCRTASGPCSTGLTIETANFGDIIAPINAVNFQDIVSIVDKFQNKPSGPSKTRTKLRESVDPSASVGFLEVSADVSAFQGKTYQQIFSTPPATCP